MAPPNDHEKLHYFDCASSGAALAADVTGSAYFAITTLVASQQRSAEGEDAPPVGVPLVLGAVSATYLASAIYGGYNGKRCSEAKAQLSDRIRAERERLAEQQRLLEQSRAGCTRDTDCKGARICEASRCVQPPESNDSDHAVTTEPVAPEGSVPVPTPRDEMPRPSDPMPPPDSP